ncbi:paxillin isoform X3 [Anopheles arabiensis]|uniref:paxillin isoform X3 n=1 Tax=Anopheles arabiensis TaxID=7173 RepID=UPI001AADB792|nr:paxillin isoform X3 [Anopheles arabiensis]
MGVMLSVLVAGVGAMDLIYCLAYVSGSEQPSNAIEDVPDKQQHEQQQQQQQPDAKVEQYKETVRQQIKAAPPRSTVEGVTYAQDGVPYKDGYRLEPSVEGAAQLDVLIEKLRILERQSQEKEQQLEQMSVQMSELERSTAEQSLIIEELRSRSTSRAHSVEPLGAYRNNLSPADAVPQIVLNEPHDSGGGGADEPRPSSSKFRPIRRDDGLRRSVKRRSVTSVTSLEDRTDELERLSQLEDEECARMDDYIPIVYSRDELQDPMNRRHNISPIPESCHHHEDDERQWVPERSPEPTLAANTTRPWGDIKLDEMKEKAVLRPSRSMSIEEEELEPPAVAQQLHVSESAPSNLSSHSNSPDREERRGSGRVEPMLRRTTKEADLTSLLQEQQKEQQQQGGASQSQLIFSGEYTKAMSKDWHSGHFCCWQCDESLTGQRYVLRDEHPYCIKCYENVFANVCEECNKTIGIDSKDLSYKDKHWHEACFLCNKCRISLVDKQFGSKADKIYCGNCYDAQFASRCDGCGEIFRAGTKKMEYKTRQWHEKCFCCCVCKTAIGTKSFIPREQEIYCAGCYEEKYATRCIKCKKIITSGGVTYKNEPWHRECFTCTHCQVSLAGQRFTSRDEKPYCAECFGELFAKRCTSCTKPITGIGGTRFISFEDRHWHNDCFICAMCKTSLVGRGFITDEQDVICPECAKQKLM